MINQCTQLLSPAADPTYVMTYINHSFPQHRQYLCGGAWILMHGHPENINSANLVILTALFHYLTCMFLLYLSLFVKLNKSNSGTCLERIFPRRSYRKYIYNGGCAIASPSTRAPAWAFFTGFATYFFPHSETSLHSLQVLNWFLSYVGAYGKSMRKFGIFYLDP